MGRKRGENYVDNSRLRELIIEYNDLNPGDDGKWLDRYEKKMTKAGKYAAVRPWIALRRQKYATPRKYTPEFQKVSEELFNMIDKIAQGRISCFQFNPEEKEDLLQEVMFAVAKYINRYREDTETSAFSYVTTICTNAIKLYLGQDNASRFCRLPWNALSDEHVATMYGSGGKEGLE